MREPNYRCQYVACVCPKCREEIILKVYTKTQTPILGADIDEPRGQQLKKKWIEEAHE